MSLQVHVRPEEENPRTGRLRGNGAPHRDLLTPVGRPIAPVDQQQADLPRRREVGRVLNSSERSLYALGDRQDPRGDDEVAGQEDDRHSASAGSAVTGLGCGCVPFDPLSDMPSIT